MNNRAKATALTGWKFILWTALGAAVTAIVESLPGVHLPVLWQTILPPILGAIGKMIATYIATGNFQ